MATDSGDATARDLAGNRRHSHRSTAEFVTTESLVVGQIRVLEMIVQGADVNATLDALVLLAEKQAPGMLGSVLLLDDDGVHVRHGAAPSLPAEYAMALDGAPIGERAGSCGTAAYRGERVIVEDILTDPLWEDYRDLAAAHGLRACWSTPIFDLEHRVLGTFALYFTQPSRPTEWHLNLIEMATHTAAVAIMRARGDAERAQLIQARHESELVFRAVFERAAVGMTLADLDGKLITCNAAFAAMLGYTITELAGARIAALTHADDVALNMRLYRQLIAGDIDRFVLEKRYLRKDGSPFWVRVAASSVLSASGTTRFTVGMVEDITTRRQAQDDLRASEHQLRELLEGLTVGFVSFDREFRFTYVNPRAAEILGTSIVALLGQRYLDAFPSAAGSQFELDYRRAMTERITVQSEQYFAPWERWFQQRVDPTPGGISVFFEDITDRKRSEQQVEYLATHDGLTDLPNRNLLHDRITQAIALVRRTDRPVAVVAVGLDRFRVINDGFGREFGDRVLAAAGARLTAAVGEADTVARLSGDEFAVLLADLRAPSDAVIRVQHMLASLAEPITIDGHVIHVTASGGTSVFPQDATSADELIAKADAAMTRAKSLGGSGFQFFTDAMSEDTRRRVQLEQELRYALQRNEMHLVFQPRVNLATGAIHGCEALLRWTHPTIGRISPAEFIPIAEESGMIVPIGEWVLVTACEQARAWKDAGLPALVVSVNLSARQFLQQDVVAWVQGILGRTGLDPASLELELTESLIAQDVERASATVDLLKETGVRVAIDDFGTGYSSLSHLKRFRADTLKIDQSFVRNLDADQDDASIVLAVIALAHNLGMSAVAEGVETEAQSRFLWLNRCEEIQGYYFSRPVRASELEEMLRTNRRLEQPTRRAHRSSMM